MTSRVRGLSKIEIKLLRFPPRSAVEKAKYAVDPPKKSLLLQINKGRVSRLPNT